MSHTFTKQPSEIFTVTMDFSRRLAESETISTKTVTAIITTTLTDATDTVISSSAIDGTDVDVKVKGGTTGLSYKITIVITTSTGNVFEDEITMTVTDS